MGSKNLSVCPSVCLLSVTKLNPNYLRTGKTESAEFFFGHLWQKAISQNLTLAPIIDLSSNLNQKPFEKSFQLWLPELFL